MPPNVSTTASSLRFTTMSPPNLESHLAQLEAERDLQRQKMEELGRQRLEITHAMNELARTLEGLDEAIEQAEQEMLLAVKAEPDRAVIKDEASVKSEPNSITHDPPPNPRRVTNAMDEVRNNDDLGDNSWNASENPTAAAMTMATQGDELLTDPFTYLTEPTQDIRIPGVDSPVPPPLRRPLSRTDSVLVTGTLPPTQPESHYSWDRTVLDLLHNTFRIPSFRDHQRDIINATLSGKDVFVIMRTGGGKSLTYQLPALLEGRYSREKKVTLVISPLLSLIQDQEEQMNQFCPGSATSFSSVIGAAEHTRRWAAVRDANSGLCLVFCTPEKVSKSNRLCSELEKLHAMGRLGRFVIDEAHCACQWGHDFRPDYALLGKLKTHFPSIPVLAVTATASDRVRNDVCEILRIRHDCALFRSTFQRPNLTYSVVPKVSKDGNVIAEMAEWIKANHPQGAGIVYTYSRKDADTVANALCDCGVVAEAYHSDVSTPLKESIHKSWMRNETQVVVATIAFGLGINKPDVRFVLHHSISKTLEAYYQESGRAGRDGNPSECILYYSPKDVIRLLKMVHGTSSEHLLWPMIRYAQESGNDPVCKAIILKHLGEPNAPDVSEVVTQNEDIVTTRRDVGAHAKTVVQLVQQQLQDGKDVTMAMLVKEWRLTGPSALPCVKNNPPGKDGLSLDDCERIITSLLLEKVLATNPVWNAYDTVIYIVLGELGMRMLSSVNPKFIVRLPKRDETKAAAVKVTKASKQSAVRKTVPKDGNWLSTKSKAVKRKKATTAKAKKPSKAVKVKPLTKKAAISVPKKSKKVAPKDAAAEVIELLSDDESQDFPLAALKQDSEADTEEVLWDDDNSSDEEYEFEN